MEYLADPIGRHHRVGTPEGGPEPSIATLRRSGGRRTEAKVLSRSSLFWLGGTRLQRLGLRLGSIALAVLAAVAAPASLAATPQASPTALTYDYGGLCRFYMAEAETRYGIVPGVLEAMGEVEAGYANTIWPWTVSVGGQALYAKSEAEAIDAIQRAVRDEKSNIDIGCLQINWHWHSHRASGPEVFLNPRANVYYAARYLAELYDEFGSLDDAVMAYHSRDPERAQAYLCRVYRVLLRRYPEVRDVVHDACPGMLAGRLLADDLVADWRAPAPTVEVLIEAPIVASASKGAPSPVKLIPQGAGPADPETGSATETTAKCGPSQAAIDPNDTQMLRPQQFGTRVDGPGHEPRQSRTMDLLRLPSADRAHTRENARMRDRVRSSAAGPRPSASPNDRPELGARLGSKSGAAEVSDNASALNELEGGWDPFPEPGPEASDVAASGIAFTVPSDGVRVHSDRDRDVGRLAKRPQATTLLEQRNDRRLRAPPRQASHLWQRVANRARICRFSSTGRRTSPGLIQQASSKRFLSVSSSMRPVQIGDWSKVEHPGQDRNDAKGCANRR